MSEALEILLRTIDRCLNDAYYESHEVLGHEYDSKIFRPFNPNQCEEKAILYLKKKIDSFLENATDSEKETLLSSSEYKEYLSILNPLPLVDGDISTNYAVVVINDVFYLLENKFYGTGIKMIFAKKEYTICKDTIDIYTFINILGNTKGDYSIGIDDFSYYIDGEEKSYRYSEIQIGEDRDDLLVVSLIDQDNRTIIEFNNQRIFLEENKPFIITKDKQCYCGEVKLTENGFEIIEGINGYKFRYPQIYPDMTTVDSESLSTTKSIDLNCYDAQDKWHETMRNKYKVNKKQ